MVSNALDPVAAFQVPRADPQCKFNQAEVQPIGPSAYDRPVNTPREQHAGDTTVGAGRPAGDPSVGMARRRQRRQWPPARAAVSGFRGPRSCDRPKTVEVLDNARLVALDAGAPGDLVGRLEHQDARPVVGQDLLQPSMAHRLALDSGSISFTAAVVLALMAGSKLHLHGSARPGGCGAVVAVAVVESKGRGRWCAGRDNPVSNRSASPGTRGRGICVTSRFLVGGDDVHLHAGHPHGLLHRLAISICGEMFELLSLSSETILIACLRQQRCFLGDVQLVGS